MSPWLLYHCGECLCVLWTSSTRPMWIVCLSEPFLRDKNWRNLRERGLDCMEGDREPPTWLSASLIWLCWPYEDFYCRGAELPRSCRNHSLLYTQRYCHQFAQCRLRFIPFWMSVMLLNEVSRQKNVKLQNSNFLILIPFGSKRMYYGISAVSTGAAPKRCSEHEWKVGVKGARQ